MKFVMAVSIVLMKPMRTQKIVQIAIALNMNSNVKFLASAFQMNLCVIKCEIAEIMINQTKNRIVDSAQNSNVIMGFVLDLRHYAMVITIVGEYSSI